MFILGANLATDLITLIASREVAVVPGAIVELVILGWLLLSRTKSHFV